MTLLGALVLWAAERAYMGLWLLLTAQLVRASGVPPARLSLGSGPTRRIGTVGGVEVHLGWLPFGGWVAPEEERAFPDAALVAPHLVLGVAGAVLAPTAAAAIVRWLAGLAWIGDSRVGWIGGLAAALGAATTSPFTAVAGTWAWLGLVNVLQGTVQAAARRAPVGLVAGVVLLALLVHGLWLDVAG